MPFNLTIENHQPVLRINEDCELSKTVNASNSPILFGCRTGICGTCMVEIISSDQPLPKPSDDEIEVLKIFERDPSRYRLACQMKMKCNLQLRYVGK
jgi:ferredoxin